MGIDVSLYTPAYPPDVGGNASSTYRLVRGLRGRGVRVKVYRSGRGAPKSAAEWQERIVHVFHAYRSGSPLLGALRAFRPHLVVSMAGTDLSHDLVDEDRAAAVREVCELAHALIVMHPGQADQLSEAMPDVAWKVATIPPGVALPPAAGESSGQDGSGRSAKARALRRAWRIGEDEVLFLLPAGLREVKRPALAVPLFERMVQEGYKVAFVLVGPVIDLEVAEAFDRAASGRPWVRRRPPLPFSEMTTVYEAADVVLNTSLSEGLSNAVIEAMAAGRPVLASDIPGNKACVVQEESGLLFRDQASFLEAARRLAQDGQLRLAMGQRARRHVARRFDLVREVEMHRALYERLISGECNLSHRHHPLKVGGLCE